MSSDPYEQIDRQIESFPPLPATVNKVLQVTGDPDSSASDLLEAIQPDPSICTAILQIANSALFGQMKKVSSLEKAITILGFSEVESIVMGKAVASSFNGLLPRYTNEVELFWQHSFTSGLAAKIIAVHLNLSSGQFFIGGLIHDIGKLGMLLSFPEEYHASDWLTAFSTKERLREEKHAFGINHEIVASKLLEKWHLPTSLVMSAGFHHSPLDAPKYCSYPLIIQLADVMAYFCCFPELLEDRGIVAAILDSLPDVDAHWHANKLPWNDIAVESWFNWLKIDNEYGSSILKVMIA